MKRFALISLLSFFCSSVSAGIVTFDDRAEFEAFVGSFTLDDFEGSSGSPGTDLSNADYHWTMSDYACIDGNGCGENGYGVDNPFHSPTTNDFVWTYTSGAFNFNAPITAFGLDYADPFNSSVGRVILQGLDSGTNPNGSFFGIATDDGTSFSSVSYTQWDNFQAFDNVIYSRTSNGVPAPATLLLFGLGLVSVGLRRRNSSF